MIGKTLAHYKIVEKIGAGGMGEVYRASDSKLGRDVALKILPPAFAQDAERMARFQREAQVLASLNHPHIAQIFGLEEAGGTHALILELVDGLTLGDRMRRGAMPASEALPIARQVAEALECAHESGIIHRDLKPENVKLTGDGQVKVLDFGLAKAMDPLGPSLADSPTISPAISAQMTGANVILGTAGYMSPEQARGQPVDKRADVWAFGVILFEMLTGRRLFGGDTVSDSLASVLKVEPEWDQLPADTPRPLHRLLRRCLQKEAKDRLHDVADARLEIEEAIASPEAPAPRQERTILSAWLGAAGLFFGAVAVALSLWSPWSGKGPETAPRVMRFSFPLDHECELTEWVQDSPILALSPDGGRLAYLVCREEGAVLYLRSFDSEQAEALETRNAHNPFFSPDGSRIGFYTGWDVRVVTPGSVVATTIAPYLNLSARGAYWDRKDHLVFTPGPNRGLVRLDSRSGIVDTLTSIKSEEGVRSHRWPAPLPEERGVLYTESQDDILSFDDARVAVLDLRSGKSKYLVDGSMPRWVPTGHLVWARGGRLLAAPFDLEKLETTADPVAVIPDLVTRPASGVAQYTISDDGTLAYVPGSLSRARSSLHWVDESGAAEALDVPWQDYERVDVSPDGARIATVVDAANPQIWILDPDRGDETRFTLEAGGAWDARWSPDGKRIVYGSMRRGTPGLYVKATGSVTEPAARLVSGLVGRPGVSIVHDLVYFTLTNQGNAGIWVADSENPGEPRPFIDSAQFNEWGPIESPDGRFLAFMSNESGRDDVFVCTFPDAKRRWKVSTAGGWFPRWSADGRSIYYTSPAPEMMAVRLTTEPDFSAGRPRRLFSMAEYKPFLSINPADGKFLLVRNEPTESPPERIRIVVNWFEELKRLVPAE